MSSQLERLARPFGPKYVKPPAQGKFGSYIDHEVITQALLLIVGPFSFQIQQVFYNPDGLLDGCTAALTCEVDGRTVTIAEAGDCEFPQNKKTQGDRLKNAASDAIKRCAMRLGLGIEVWTGDDEPFLYKQLLKRSAGSAEPSSESGGGPDPTGPAVSAIRVQDLAARAMSLRADKVDVDGEQKAWQLPDIDKSSEKQLALWDDMLHTLELALEKPFVQETAPV